MRRTRRTTSSCSSRRPRWTCAKPATISRRTQRIPSDRRSSIREIKTIRWRVRAATPPMERKTSICSTTRRPRNCACSAMYSMGGDAMKRSLAMITLLLLPVTAFGAEAVRLRPIGSIYSDVAGSGILEPEGVGCGRLTITVADTGHGRLQQYTLSEGTIKPGTEMRVAQLSYPQRVRMNSKGDIFVLDGKQH